MQNYEPKPIDTTSIELPAHLQAKLELLAKNNHDYSTADEVLKTILALGCSIEDKNEHYFKLFNCLRERIKNCAPERGAEWEKLAWRTLGEEFVRIYYLLDMLPELRG